MYKNTFNDLNFFALCLLMLIGSGCAMQSPAPDIDKAHVWDQSKLELEQLRSWKLKARIAIQLDKEGGSASMDWKQSEDDYLIRIVPPFGRGAFELDGNSEGVTMRGSDDQIFHASNPETLLQTHLGWQVPVSGLIYWIRGLPDPNVNVKTMVLDEQARIQHLSQNSWDVSYKSYIQSDGLNLPKKMSMQNQNLKVKLVIREWEFSL